MGRPAKIYVKNGSSPHTWGIHGVAAIKEWVQRFIPTYVGYTAMMFGASGTGTVHPHIRGAYTPLLPA